MFSLEATPHTIFDEKALYLFNSFTNCIASENKPKNLTFEYFLNYTKIEKTEKFDDFKRKLTQAFKDPSQAGNLKAMTQDFVHFDSYQDPMLMDNGIALDQITIEDIERAAKAKNAVALNPVTRDKLCVIAKDHFTKNFTEALNSWELSERAFAVSKNAVNTLQASDFYITSNSDWTLMLGNFMPVEHYFVCLKEDSSFTPVNHYSEGSKENNFFMLVIRPDLNKEYRNAVVANSVKENNILQFTFYIDKNDKIQLCEGTGYNIYNSIEALLIYLDCKHFKPYTQVRADSLAEEMNIDAFLCKANIQASNLYEKKNKDTENAYNIVQQLKLNLTESKMDKIVESFRYAPPLQLLCRSSISASRHPCFTAFNLGAKRRDAIVKRGETILTRMKLTISNGELYIVEKEGSLTRFSEHTAWPQIHQEGVSSFIPVCELPDSKRIVNTVRHRAKATRPGADEYV